MLHSARRPYVCWDCLSIRSRLTPQTGARGPFNKKFRPIGSHIVPTGQRLLATVQHSNASQAEPATYSSSSAVTSTGRPLSIREKLRRWEEENPTAADLIPKDYAEPGAVQNAWTRDAHPDRQEIEDEIRDQQPVFDGDDLVDISFANVILHAGDLIEIVSNSWRAPMLAICLGKFHGIDHFYTSTGKWFTSADVQTLFTVPRFATAAEIKPVVDAIPSKDAPIEILNVLQEMKQAPGRDVGAPLIRKMVDFITAADTIHAVNAEVLDNARQHLPKEESYLSLQEVTQKLIGKYTRGGYSASHLLYAVHKTLIKNDLCFRPVSTLGPGRYYLLEIISQDEVIIAERLESVVRSFYEDPAIVGGPPRVSTLKSSILGSFVLKARDVIDKSREVREWSPNGILGPAGDAAPRPVRRQEWSLVDQQIIQFMHNWAGYQRLSKSSRLHWIGSSILRAIGRYEAADSLDTSTGWTFLQEIGWITPWDIQSRYRLRLPGVSVNRLGGLESPPLSPDQELLEPDLFAGKRAKWSCRAYCIDAASAREIDDAVSIETGPEAGQYWIRVHVADPASRIRPGSPLAERAELVPQASYLQGNYSRMFTGGVVEKYFSLAPGRPCLTFNTLVDDEGRVIQHNIKPGLLDDVVYITPSEVDKVCGAEMTPLENTELVFEVGKSPAVQEDMPDRKMTRADELSKNDVEDLRTLSRLADTLRQHRLAKGAMPLYWPQPTTQVSFDNTSVNMDSKGFLTCSGDPHIRVKYNDSRGSLLVESTMRLAGETAAKWCSERGIPIPYQTQPQAVPNRHRLEAFTEKVLYPQLRAGKRPTQEQWRILRVLVGFDEVLAKPVPHFLMGADMYAKVTSPLRRFSDLLCHWQIEAALLEEDRRRSSLRGNRNTQFLPFPLDRLDQEVLPMLRVRQRAMRVLDNVSGNEQWILQALVRAWRFGDVTPGTAPIPTRFRFTAHDVVVGRIVRGRLEWFGMMAMMKPDGLNAMGVSVAGIRAGDTFEVELDDVNVYDTRIMVRAVGVLGREANEVEASV